MSITTSKGSVVKNRSNSSSRPRSPTIDLTAIGSVFSLFARFMTVTSAPRTRRCLTMPVLMRPVPPRMRTFINKRDIGKWFNEQYGPFSPACIHATRLSSPKSGLNGIFEQWCIAMDRKHSLVEIAAVFTRLGFTAFGGPAVHAGMMEDEVVTPHACRDRQHFLDLVS